MRAHVFVVDDETFPVHRDRRFCGTDRDEIPQTYNQVLAAGRRYLGIIADLLGTRVDDLVFLYHRQKGFRGIYRIAGAPFFDPTDVSGIGEFSQNVVPGNIAFRVPIECAEYFPDPVPEDLIFATPKHEQLHWIWFHRKIVGPRGCTTINPESAKGLIELLVKVNGHPTNPPPTQPYPMSGGVPLSLPIEVGRDPLEDAIRAWVIGAIDDPAHASLREIFGPAQDLEWFGNNVPYHVAMRNIDILAFHATQTYTGAHIRYRYSVVELKRDRGFADDIDQLISYCKWVAARLAGGEVDTVQPIFIAKRFSADAIERARHTAFNRTGIRLATYQVDAPGSLCFTVLNVFSSG